MATLISGKSSREVHPKGGIFFAHEELRKLLGLHQRRPVAPVEGRLLCGPSNVPGVKVVFVEWGKDSGKELNHTATLMYKHSYKRLIYGPALVGSELEVSCPEVERDGPQAKSA